MDPAIDALSLPQVPSTMAATSPNLLAGARCYVEPFRNRVLFPFLMMATSKAKRTELQCGCGTSGYKTLQADARNNKSNTTTNSG